MAKYIVTTDLLFLSDTISVGRGIFDTSEYPQIKEEKLKALTQSHPRDIREAKPEEFNSRPSKIEENNQPLGKKEADQKPDPKDPQDPTKTVVDSENITVQQLKDVLTEKKVEFKPNATKAELYPMYVEAMGK